MFELNLPQRPQGQFLPLGRSRMCLSILLFFVIKVSFEQLLFIWMLKRVRTSFTPKDYVVASLYQYHLQVAKRKCGFSPTSGQHLQVLKVSKCLKEINCAGMDRKQLLIKLKCKLFADMFSSLFFGKPVMVLQEIKASPEYGSRERRKHDYSSCHYTSWKTIMFFSIITVRSQITNVPELHETAEKLKSDCPLKQSAALTVFFIFWHIQNILNIPEKRTR